MLKGASIHLTCLMSSSDDIACHPCHHLGHMCKLLKLRGKDFGREKTEKSWGCLTWTEWCQLSLGALESVKLAPWPIPSVNQTPAIEHSDVIVNTTDDDRNAKNARVKQCNLKLIWLQALTPDSWTGSQTQSVLRRLTESQSHSGHEMSSCSLKIKHSFI